MAAFPRDVSRMMSRGVLYMVWGKKAEAALTRSLASLNNVHPELSREIISLPPGTDGYKGPPASFGELNAYYRKPESIIQFHAPAGASR